MKLKLTLILLSCVLAQLQAETPFQCSCDERQCKVTNGGESMSKFFDCLEDACKVAKTIPDKEEKESVCNALESCKRDLWMQSLGNKEKFRETAECFYENCDEILAECSNPKFREAIAFHINEMMENLD